MDKIEIVIVTGMSGAGKTTAMAAFENMAYCCIDNYPIALLGAFSEFLKDNTNYQRIAMAVSLADAPKAIRFLNNVDWLNVSVIFYSYRCTRVASMYRPLTVLSVQRRYRLQFFNFNR